MKLMEKNSACIKNIQQYTIEIHTSQRQINYSKVVEKKTLCLADTLYHLLAPYQYERQDY